MYGTSAVRKLIFHRYSEFGKGFSRFFGNEYGVVAKAFVATTLRSDVAFDFPLESMLLAIDDESNHGAESCLALRHALHLVEDFIDIGVGIVAIGVGIARSVHTWAPTECIDFQSRIVGKNGESVAFVNEARLLQGVALECIGRFGNIAFKIDVGKRENLKLIAHDGRDFSELVDIVGSYDELHKEE